MLEQEEIRNLDSFSLYLSYDRWALYCREAYTMNVDVDWNDVNKVVFTGMGGSATSGEIISYLFNEQKSLQIYVVRDYNLPHITDSKTLVIASSVSGNTEETLATLLDAINRNVKCIAVSSGGRMEELCRAKGVNHVKIKNLGVPRATLPCLLYTHMRIIRDLVNINDSLILDSINDLEWISRKIGSSTDLETNAAKQLAVWIGRGLPACLCSPLLRPVAKRFKDSMNENAKTCAIFDDILESSHNTIEAFSNRESTLRPILLPCTNDNGKIDQRFGIVEQYLSSQGYNPYRIPKIGSSLLSNMICTIYLLDYASIYLAILREIDPGSTLAIDYIKKGLNVKRR